MKRIAAVLVVLMMGCSTPRAASDASYLADRWDGKSDPHVMKSNLTRSNNSTGFFYIEAQLESPALIQAEHEAKAKNRALSADESERELGKELRELADNKTCFLFTLSSLIIETGYFRDYEAFATDSTGRRYPIQFIATHGVESVPTTMPSHGYEWTNFGAGCTQKKLDLAHSFSLHFASKSQDRAPAAEMVWDVKK